MNTPMNETTEAPTAADINRVCIYWKRPHTGASRYDSLPVAIRQVYGMDLFNWIIQAVNVMTSIHGREALHGDDRQALEALLESAPVEG